MSLFFKPKFINSSPNFLPHTHSGSSGVSSHDSPEHFFEELEKGKAFPVGQIREWGGKKYRKVSDKKWERVRDHKKAVGGGVPEKGDLKAGDRVIIPDYAGDYYKGPGEVVKIEEWDDGRRMVAVRTIGTKSVTWHEASKLKSTQSEEKTAPASGLKPNKKSSMYERGRQDGIRFGYVPDFKNEQEKADWTAGYGDQKRENEKHEAANAMHDNGQDGPKKAKPKETHHIITEKGISFQRMQEVTGQKNPSAAEFRAKFDSMNPEEQQSVIENVHEEIAEIHDELKNLRRQREDAAASDKSIYSDKIKKWKKVLEGKEKYLAQHGPKTAPAILGVSVKKGDGIKIDGTLWKVDDIHPTNSLGKKVMHVNLSSVDGKGRVMGGPIDKLIEEKGWKKAEKATDEVKKAEAKLKADKESAEKAEKEDKIGNYKKLSLSDVEGAKRWVSKDRETGAYTEGRLSGNVTAKPAAAFEMYGEKFFVHKGEDRRGKPVYTAYHFGTGAPINVHSSTLKGALETAQSRLDTVGNKKLQQALRSWEENGPLGPQMLSALSAKDRERSRQQQEKSELKSKERHERKQEKRSFGTGTAQEQYDRAVRAVERGKGSDEQSFEARQAKKYSKILKKLKEAAMKESGQGSMFKSMLASFGAMADQILQGDEILQKGAKAAIGTTADWGGKKYRKESEGVWKPIGGERPGGRGDKPANDAGEKDPKTSSELHSKFMDVLANMTDAGRAAFRGGKFDAVNKRFVSSNGKHALEYRDGEVGVVTLKKSGLQFTRLFVGLFKSVREHKRINYDSNNLGNVPVMGNHIPADATYEHPDPDLGKPYRGSKARTVLTLGKHPLPSCSSEEEEVAKSLPRIFVKSRTHKYIRRTGTPGKYQYFYADDNKGQRKHHQEPGEGPKGGGAAKSAFSKKELKELDQINFSWAATMDRQQAVSEIKQIKSDLSAKLSSEETARKEFLAGGQYDYWKKTGSEDFAGFFEDSYKPRIQSLISNADKALKILTKQSKSTEKVSDRDILAHIKKNPEIHRINNDNLRQAIQVTKDAMSLPANQTPERQHEARVRVAALQRVLDERGPSVEDQFKADMAKYDEEEAARSIKTPADIKDGMFASNDDSNFWKEGDQVYRVPKGASTDVNGRPSGMRWESSIGNFMHFNKDVHKAYLLRKDEAKVFADQAPFVSDSTRKSDDPEQRAKEVERQDKERSAMQSLMRAEAASKKEKQTTTSGITEQQKESLYAQARSNGSLYESQSRSMSGADQTDSEKYRLTAKAFRELADGKELESVLEGIRAEWKGYADQVNKRVDSAPKTKRGPYSGQSSMSHRWANPEGMENKIIHIRNMYKKITGTENA